MSQSEQIRAIKDELNELVVNECDQFFVGYAAQATGSFREQIAKMYERRDLKGIDNIAREIMKSKRDLEFDDDLLTYFEHNLDDLFEHTGYDQLHRLYKPEELGFKDKVELVNVITRTGLARCLGSRLVHTEAQSTHETVVRVILEYINFAIGKIMPQIPQFRLLYQERERNCDIYPQITFVASFMEQLEILLGAVEAVLIKNGAAQDQSKLEAWVIKSIQELEEFYEITHKLRVFSNTLDKRIIIGKEGEPVRVIEYIVKNIPDLASLYEERALKKKQLISRCLTLFDMSYAITGLDWLLSNVSKESGITVSSLGTKITSEIELFNLFMMCPSAVIMEWLIGHLILDCSLMSQSDSPMKRNRADQDELKEEEGAQSREEAKDLSMTMIEEKCSSASVKEYLMSVDPGIRKEGVYERIVHLWLLDYMIDFARMEVDPPLWVIQRISEVVTQVDLIKQRDHKRADLDELLLLTLSTFDVVGLEKRIPACFHSRIVPCFNQLPQLFQHLVLKQEASQGFISQILELCLTVEDYPLRLVCFLNIIRYATHNRHFLELAGADQIYMIKASGYHQRPSLFEALKDYYVSRAAQYAMAKYLCHVGRTTEGIFFFVRLLPDLFENERLVGILQNDLPFFVEAVTTCGSSPLLRQAYECLQSLEVPSVLQGEVELLLENMVFQLKQDKQKDDLKELNLIFKNETQFRTDSQGLLEDVALSPFSSPTLSSIGRKKLFERKELRDRQINASIRARKIATGQWEQDMSAQELSFAPPIDSLLASKEEREEKMNEELDENMIREEVEKEDETEGIGDALHFLMNEDD